jgi:acyl-CoA dehydrogenase
MNLALSDKGSALRAELLRFMDEEIYPAESVYAGQLAEGNDPYFDPPVMEELKASARKRQLWNLFLADQSGISTVDYAYLAEILGRSYIASEAVNCAFPDSGNMEILSMFGTAQQKDRWLRPLLDGEIRSCFSMTERDVASSDPTGIRTTITEDGDDLIVSGRKWWVTGGARKRCELIILLAKSNPSASSHRQMSIVLLPRHTPGIETIRDLEIFGYTDHEGHQELELHDVRIPRDGGYLGDEGDGFSIAQARLAPGRIHHCMRSIGVAERALELLCERAYSRQTFGAPLAEQGIIKDWIAESRLDIEQARLAVQKAAWEMDTHGHRQAMQAISVAKALAPNAALRVVDRAIQVHGAAGVCQDFPLAEMWAHLRTLRIGDGADEVHKMVIARRETSPYRRPSAADQGREPVRR